MRAQSVCSGGARPRVAGGDRGLQRVGAEAAAEPLGALERGEPAADQQLVPARAVLVEQQHRLAARARARAQARGLDLHQRHEPVDLGFARRQLGQHAPEPQRLLAQVLARPVVAGGGRVALVEDEVDDLEHGGEPRRQLLAARHLERHLRLGERALGPHDPLRDGALGDEEGACDLGRGQAAEQAQRQRDPGLGGEHRVTAGEDEPQQVVGDVVDLERALVAGECDLELAHELLLLALERGGPPQRVDRAVLGGGHEPGARVVRDARLRPRLQRGDQRVLREVLGEADVADDAGQARDQPGGLDPPDRVDRALGGAHAASAPGSAGAAPRRAARPTGRPRRSRTSRTPAGPRSRRRPRSARGSPTRRPPPST